MTPTKFVETVRKEFDKPGSHNRARVFKALARVHGVDEERAAEAAALALAFDARKSMPGLFRPHLKSLGYLAVIALYFWSAFAFRREPVRAEPAAPPGSIEALSASLPTITDRTFVSLSAANLPAPLTAKLPVRLALTLSPKVQSTATPYTAFVWVVSEERSGATSRIVVAAPADVVRTIAERLASSDATMLFPR